MSEYYINGQALSQFGITATRSAGTSLAVTGAWDLPKRKGDAYHDWPEADAVEAFVDAEDLVFEGRQIAFTGLIAAGGGKTLLERISAFRAFMDGISAGMFTLSCPWGQWNVQLASDVQTDRLDEKAAAISVSFLEPAPDLTGTLPTPMGTGDDIDGYGWEEFGLYVSSVSGAFDTERRKEIGLTKAANDNSLSFGGKEARKITINGTLIADSYTAIKANIKALYGLFAAPGLRNYKYRGASYRCFAPDGFKVSGLIVSSRTTAAWTITLTTADND